MKLPSLVGINFLDLQSPAKDISPNIILKQKTLTKNQLGFKVISARRRTGVSYPP